jgi:hypothetical protein
MTLGSVTVLTLSLAFVGFGASSSLNAQDVSATSISDEVAQCVKWMQATVPDVRPANDGDLRKLDAAHSARVSKREGSTVGVRSFNADSRRNTFRGWRPGIARRLVKFTRGIRGRLDFAPQRSAETTCSRGTPALRATRNTPLRFTA